MEEWIFHTLSALAVPAIIGLLMMWKRQAEQQMQIDALVKNAVERRLAAEAIERSVDKLFRLHEVHVAECTKTREANAAQFAQIARETSKGFDNDREHYKERNAIDQRVTRLESKS